MDERRNAVRIPVEIFTHISDRKTKRLIGYLMNVTQGGALLVSEYAYPPGSNVHLRITLPLEYEIPAFVIDALVIWCSPDRDSVLTRVGVKWVNLEAQQEDQLEKIISNLTAG